MGTNYYIAGKAIEPCPHCGQAIEIDRVHIGKHSYGWAFLFSPKYPTFQEWKAVLEENADQIFDEYGDNVHLPDLLTMFERIKNQLWEGNAPPPGMPFQDAATRCVKYEYKDAEGYRFSKREGFR